MHKYLFVLSPPYSGSTVLWRLLATSPVVAAHPTEGQSLDGVRHLIRDSANPWDPNKVIPWQTFKERWEQEWDMTKPILLEKSPPNIFHASEIEDFFSPSYFIAIIRDPYAFCEGRRRRYPDDIKLSAEFWTDCATYQRRNIEGLKRVTYFKYEDFANDPKAIKAKILGFMPDLQDIDTEGSFKARAIRGYRPKPIRNFNQEKIDRLSSQDIRDVNSVLRQHGELMDYFGYKYLEPTIGHSLRHAKTTAVLNTLEGLRKTKRFGESLLHRG